MPEERRHLSKKSLTGFILSLSAPFVGGFLWYLYQVLDVQYSPIPGVLAVILFFVPHVIAIVMGVIGMIYSIKGLINCYKEHKSGKGLAIAGIILGRLATLLFALFFVFWFLAMGIVL